MALFLIVGEEPSTVPNVVKNIDISSIECSLLCSSYLETLAEKLGVTVPGGTEELKRKNSRETRGVLTDFLWIWIEQFRHDATFGILCQAISLCRAEKLADNLYAAFEKILQEQLLSADGDFVSEKTLKLKEVFPSGLPNRVKKNNPNLLLDRLKTSDRPVSRDNVVRAMEKMSKQFDAQQLKIIEAFSFKKFSSYFKVESTNAEWSYDEVEAQQLIQKMNVTNPGLSFSLCYIVARAMMKSSWEYEQEKMILLGKIFKTESDFPYKFKNKIFVFFADWLLGMRKEEDYECYNFSLDLSQHLFFTRLCIACVKCNAVNLLSEVYKCHEFLHRIVTDTEDLQGSELEMVKDLVRNKMNEDPRSVTNRNGYNITPLLMHYIHVEIIQLLLENNETNAHELDPRGQNFVHYAVVFNSSKQVQQLLQMLIDHGLTELLHVRDKQQRIPFFFWLRKTRFASDVISFQLLVSAGNNFTATDKFGYGALHYAVNGEQSIELFKSLVNLGCDWRKKDLRGATLLHYAAKEGYLDAVEYFFNLGIDVNSLDDDLNTPLHYAVTPQENFNCDRLQLETINFLLSHGAYLDAINKNGKTAAQNAFDSKEMDAYRVLLSKGATSVSVP